MMSVRHATVVRHSRCHFSDVASHFSFFSEAHIPTVSLGNLYGATIENMGIYTLLQHKSGKLREEQLFQEPRVWV
jgi:hypothetical protein